MYFSTIIGHKFQKEFIKSSIKSGQIANSYLFFGPEGVGKKLLALEYAKILNCLNFDRDDFRDDSEHCTCSSCNKIDKGMHPDIAIISSEGLKEIKIDQIREQIEDLIYLKPYEGKCKVSIVDDADLMNINAQNAFLKTLEEPPVNSVIILVTSKPQYLLPTIKSRCQKLEFFSLSDEVIKQKMDADLQFDEQHKDLAIALSQGSLSKMRLLDPEFMLLRKEVINQFAVLRMNNANDICSFVERFSRDKTAEANKKLELIFEMLFLWLKDIIYLKTGLGKERLVQKDLYDIPDQMCSRWTYEIIIDNRNFLEDARVNALTKNVNKQYILENLVLKFTENNN